MRAAVGQRPGSRTGPFTVGLDAHGDDPMRNYAVPDHGARPTAADVDDLIAFFRAAQRIPRLEYIEESAPATWPVLAAAAFTVECRTPVMIATPDHQLTPRSPAGITIRHAVGVLTAYRRRGIASAISAYLADTAHTRGIGPVFLEAEPEEERIYRRTGFTDATAKLWTSLR